MPNAVLRSFWNGPTSCLGERAAFVALTCAGLCGLAILRARNPATSHTFPPCPFHALTGLFCPGCGSTRGLHQLLHGHVRAAFALNPFMVLCVPIMIYAYGSYAARVWFPQASFVQRRRAPLPAFLIWALFCLILCFWVLRNIPRYPFTALAPH